jgi:hypothetical protein
VTDLQHPHTPAPAPIRCPRCGADVGPEQDWCLECGAPARTRLASTPNWRLPVLVLTIIVLVAGIALAVAFTALTRDDGTIAAATATTAPAQPNETTTQAPPAIVAPPASSAAPASPSTAAPAG